MHLLFKSTSKSRHFDNFYTKYPDRRMTNAPCRYTVMKWHVGCAVHGVYWYASPHFYICWYFSICFDIWMFCVCIINHLTCMFVETHLLCQMDSMFCESHASFPHPATQMCFGARLTVFSALRRRCESLREGQRGREGGKQGGRR